MQEQLGQQQGLTTTCNLQKLRVQEVLEFFGREALDRIAQTSVKLRDKLQEPKSPRHRKVALRGLVYKELV